MAVLGRGQPLPAVISRGSLADAPVLTTPPPKVIQAAATPGFGQPNAGKLVRSSLQDFATPVTPAPLVIPAALTPGWGRAGPPVIGVAPLIVAIVTQATPAPVVAWQQPPAVPPQQALTSRSSLADAPVLTTPRPFIIPAAATPGWATPAAGRIYRSSLADAPVLTTPPPVIVALAVKLAAAQPPVILQNGPASGTPPPPLQPFDPYQLGGVITAGVMAGTITADNYAGAIT